MVIDDGFLHIRIEDDGIPRGLHNTVVKLRILLPVALIVDENLVMKLIGPLAHSEQQRIDFMLRGGEDVVVL